MSRSPAAIARSEYVRELIRKEQDKQKLRDLLLEGANSPPAAPVDDSYFERLHERVSKGAAKRA
jgi:antitoxin ParD1/3/4